MKKETMSYSYYYNKIWLLIIIALLVLIPGVLGVASCSVSGQTYYYCGSLATSQDCQVNCANPTFASICKTQNPTTYLYSGASDALECLQEYTWPAAPADGCATVGDLQAADLNSNMISQINSNGWGCFEQLITNNPDILFQNVGTEPLINQLNPTYLSTIWTPAVRTQLQDFINTEFGIMVNLDTGNGLSCAGTNNCMFDYSNGELTLTLNNAELPLSQYTGLTIGIGPTGNLEIGIDNIGLLSGQQIPIMCGGQDLTFKFDDANAGPLECVGGTGPTQLILGMGTRVTTGMTTVKAFDDGTAVYFGAPVAGQDGIYVNPDGSIDIIGNVGATNFVFNCGIWQWSNGQVTKQATTEPAAGQTCMDDQTLIIRHGDQLVQIGNACANFYSSPDDAMPFCDNFADEGDESTQSTCTCSTPAAPGVVDPVGGTCAEKFGLSASSPALSNSAMNGFCMYCDGGHSSLCERKLAELGPDATQADFDRVGPKIETFVASCQAGMPTGCSGGIVGGVVPAGISAGECAATIGLPSSLDLTNAELNNYCTYCDGGYASLCARVAPNAPDATRAVELITNFVNQCKAGTTTGCKSGEISSCGDETCSDEETGDNCPSDCSVGCGDGTCDHAGTENAETCPADCTGGREGGFCGDGNCNTFESFETCPSDCSITQTECTPGRLEQCFPAQEDYTCTYSRTCDQNGTWGSCTKTDSNCPESCTDGIELSCPRQFGVCAGAVQTCSGSSWPGCQDIYAGIEGYSTTEICGDFLDNNCNGLVDENCACGLGDDRSCGTEVGACSLGTQMCVDSTVENQCNGGINPRPELCNDGIDNDCDGSVDEFCACGQTFGEGFERTCGENACGSGTQTCQDNNGQIVWGECVGNILPQIESCGDDIDNDCDGSINEGCGCLEDTTCGVSDVGACSTGTQVCSTTGLLGTCTGSTLPGEEVCGNNIDDDCDGSTDENCPCAEGELKACSTEGVCAGVQVACGSDGTFPECDYSNIVGYESKESNCGDFRDNDCDGIIDNEDPDCKETSTSITCSDGTPNNACSTTKPNYCDGGSLIESCSKCTCAQGLRCDVTGKCVADTKPTLAGSSGNTGDGTCNFDGICGITEDTLTCSDCIIAEEEKESNTLIWLALALILIGGAYVGIALYKNSKIKPKEKPKGGTTIEPRKK